MLKYVLYPGHVRSQHDGDYHFISAKQLAQLYRVPMEECLVIDYEQARLLPTREKLALYNQAEHLIQLSPRYKGDYSLP